MQQADSQHLKPTAISDSDHPLGAAAHAEKVRRVRRLGMVTKRGERREGNTPPWLSRKKQQPKRPGTEEWPLLFEHQKLNQQIILIYTDRPPAGGG